MINYVYQWFFCFYCLSNVLIYVNGNYINFYDGLNRVKRATKKCTGFLCIISGECLEIEQRCDGKVDCKDASDEFDNCKNEISCPAYLFTCEYGACIDTNKVCDGKKDCRDNSDEDNCKNKTKRSIAIPIRPPANIRPPTYIESCKLPDQPANGRWTIIGENKTLYGRKVKIGTILTFICNYKYTLSNQNNLLTCISDREWSATPPNCQKICPSLFITDKTEVTCYEYSKIGEIKCDSATNGSIARFTCAPFYEPDNEKAMTNFCWDGVWISPPPQCIPVCGKKRITALPLIAKGQIVEKGLYPWVTAVYQNVSNKFQIVCGGTMLSQRVILTAAHCVSDNDGVGVNPENVKIGVGKYYNGYKDTRDTMAQYSDIQEILIHKSYRGENQRYSSDIAFLITKDELHLSIVVQPVCYLNLPHIHLSTNIEGVISGWGYSYPNTSISEELKNVRISYEDDDTCTATLSNDWLQRYNTYDKICAGNYNESTLAGTGDSGGGLVFPYNGRYYIHGILSVGERNVSNHALYTNVSRHYDWLEQVVAQYKKIYLFI